MGVITMLKSKVQNEIPEKRIKEELAKLTEQEAKTG